MAKDTEKSLGATLEEKLLYKKSKARCITLADELYLQPA